MPVCTRRSVATWSAHMIFTILHKRARNGWELPYKTKRMRESKGRCASKENGKKHKHRVESNSQKHNQEEAKGAKRGTVQ